MLTARELNRATLARQMLLRREAVGVEEAVRRVVAIQAQHPASPYLALWNRVEGFRPADLDAAVGSHALVKATLLRITLHLVHAGDYGVLHHAMQPTLRGARLGDRRFTQDGVGVAAVEAALPGLLAFADRPRRPADLEAWLADHLGVPATGVWWALRASAPLVHAPTGGPWSFGPRPSYLAAAGRVADGWSGTPEDALQSLVLRYLAGFGPASVADVAQFALVRRGRVREALAGLGDVLEPLDGPDGTPLVDLPGAPRPPADTPAPPRLMAMWDSTLLAYADRARIIPPELRRLVIRANGDVLPTLLVDGYVAGVWRPVDGGIEATAFHPLPEPAWEALAAEARALVALLADREPRVYRRYDRWWSHLPGDAEVRVLPGTG